MNVLGGFLAAAAFAAASAFITFARRPCYVPRNLEKCTDRVQALLLRAGVGPGDVFPLDQVVWVPAHSVPNYEAEGSEVIRVRPYLLKCEVRALEPSGHLVLMTKPSGATEGR